MIIQFDVNKAAQGAGPKDHVWKIGLTNSEVATLHGIVEAARLTVPGASEPKVFGDGIIHALKSVLDQVRAGKPFPVVTVDTTHVSEPVSLPVVLTGQGEYAQAWPPESASPPVTPALIPHPDSNHGGHACYCSEN